MNFGGVNMRPLGSHATDEASSAGNNRMNGPRLKRKRNHSSNCHQCHRNDKEMVIRCPKCFCITCNSKWCTGMQKTDFAEACVICHNICNYTACLQSDVTNKDWMPRHFREFVRCVPFKHYTYPRCGYLSICKNTEDVIETRLGA